MLIESDCPTLIPEESSNSNEDLENANDSASHTQTETNINLDEEFANLKEDIECVNTSITKIYSEEVNHFYWECIADIKLRRGWPKSLKSLRFYQFVQMSNYAIYQSGEEKILLMWFFYGTDFTSNPICRYPVVDIPKKEPQDKNPDKKILFYSEIDENEYKKNGFFRFIDYPSTAWLPLTGYDLIEVHKEHDFYLYIVAVGENGEEVPVKYLPWRYSYERKYVKCLPSFAYTCEGRVEMGIDFAYEPEPTNLAEYPFQNQLRTLPDANDRQFLFQCSNLSENPAHVRIYPNVLPEGYSKETFNERIIELWKSNPELFHQAK